MPIRFKLLSSPSIRFSLPVSEDLFDKLSAHLESLNRPIKGLCWVDSDEDRVRLSSSADLAEAVECEGDVVVLDYPETSDDSDSGEDSDRVEGEFDQPPPSSSHGPRRLHRSRFRDRDRSQSRDHSGSRIRLEKRKMRILRRMREGRMKPFGHRRALGPFDSESRALHGPFGGFAHRGPHEHGPFGDFRHGPEGHRGFFGGRGPRGDKYYHQGPFGCPGRRLGHGLGPRHDPYRTHVIPSPMSCFEF